MVCFFTCEVWLVADVFERWSFVGAGSDFAPTKD